MIMRGNGSFGERKGMSGAVSTIEEARELAQRLERRKTAQGMSVDAARESLSRRIGIAPRTWKNLAGGRLKRLDAWLRDGLQALLIRELENEIARLTHELDLARQGGAHPASLDVGAIETHLAKAKALLNEGISP